MITTIKQSINKILEKSFDFHYHRKESKDIINLTERLIQASKDVNEARGKVAIYYRELVSLNRTVARKSYRLKQLNKQLMELKLQHPELFDIKSEKLVKVVR